MVLSNIFTVGLEVEHIYKGSPILDMGSQLNDCSRGCGGQDQPGLWYKTLSQKIKQKLCSKLKF